MPSLFQDEVCDLLKRMQWYTWVVHKLFSDVAVLLVVGVNIAKHACLVFVHLSVS